MNYTKEKLEEIYAHCKSYKIQQKKPEWFSVLELLNSQNRKFNNILDIGVYDGGTSISLSYFTSKLFSLDISPCRYKLDDLTKNCDYKYLKGNSQLPQVVQQVHDIVGKVDVLMIDGDHTYEGSLNDYKNYHDMVNPNGIIIFHDIVESDEHKRMNCYVHQAWNEVKAMDKNKDKWLEIIYDNDGNKHDNISIQSTQSPWGGIGILFT